MDRNLALELVRVTEAAALACGRWVGKGDKNAADEAATSAMRRTLDSIKICGTVVIGEGEMDEAPMLYIGEKVGDESGSAVDIAVDPLEGTNICAKGLNGAITTIAMAPQGGFLHAPDMYMEKIAVGPTAKGAIDINASPTENLKRVAEAKSCYVEDLTVVILDRPRHDKTINEIRKAGARIHLSSDGDVAPAIAAAGLEPATLKAWEEYVESANIRMEQRLRPGKTFLWADEAPERLARVRAGEVVVSPVSLQMPKRVPSHRPGK